MKISLITTTFNSGATLRDTFRSILLQSYTNIEYIVIDGLSKDKTVDIIKEYEPLFNGRMKWISERDNGLYDAMNKGIKMSTGEIVGILNSDDIFQDGEVLNDIVLSFERSIDAVFGNLCFVKYEDVNSIVRIWKGSPYRSFSTGWHPAHPTFYVRRNIYEKYGLFNTSFKVSADFELMLRFMEKYHINTKYLDRYMVKMRVGGESTGSLINIIRGNKNIMRAFEKNEIKISPFYPMLRLFPKVIDVIKYKILSR